MSSTKSCRASLKIRKYNVWALLVSVTTSGSFAVVAQPLCWGDETAGAEYFSEKKYDKAIVEFSKTIEKDPTNAEAYVNRGASFELAGEHEKAKKDQLVAIKLLRAKKDKPLLSQALSNKAAVERSLHHEKQARVDSRKALRLDPGNASAQAIFNSTLGTACPDPEVT